MGTGGVVVKRQPLPVAHRGQEEVQEHRIARQLRSKVAQKVSVNPRKTLRRRAAHAVGDQEMFVNHVRRPPQECPEARFGREKIGPRRPAAKRCRRSHAPACLPLATTALSFGLGVFLSVLFLAPEPTLTFGSLPATQQLRAFQLPTVETVGRPR